MKIIITAVLCVFFCEASSKAYSEELNEVIELKHLTWKKANPTDIPSLISEFIVFIINENYDVLCCGSLVTENSIIAPLICLTFGWKVTVPFLNSEVRNFKTYSYTTNELAARHGILSIVELDSKIDYWPSLIPVLFNTNITPCKKNVFGVGLEEDYQPIVKKLSFEEVSDGMIFVNKSDLERYGKPHLGELLFFGTHLGGLLIEMNTRGGFIGYKMV